MNEDDQYRASSTAVEARPDIPSFYEGRSVFVTGFSGFLGKVLVEKLLRSCPGVDKVYVLVRDKAGRVGSGRLGHLLQSKVFDRVRQANPDAMGKVVPIAGDLCSVPLLGISEDDQSTLASEVSVVFHCAATVKFEEPLRTAVQLNVGGTASVLELCKRMTSLAAFVHVSTAYCNCEHKRVEEKIYPAPVNPDKLLDSLTWLDAAAMDALYPKIKGEKVNTYIFTKAAAESYLEKNGRGMPIAIFRPSIVGNSWQEPYPGWVDAAHGAGGLIMAVAAGAWRFSNTKPEALINGIPVDMCVSLMLAIAWDLGTRHPGAADRMQLNNRPLSSSIDDQPALAESAPAPAAPQEPPKVYNFFSAILRPMTWGRGIELDLHLARHEYAFENTVWYPTHIQEKYAPVYRVQTALREALPAHLADVALRMSGRKPFAARMYEKINNMASTLTFFINGSWRFESTNVPDLLETLSPEDRKTFNFNVLTLDWEEYVHRCVLGCRTYFLKQDPSTIPSSIKRIRRLRHMRILLKMFLLGLLLLTMSAIFLCAMDSGAPGEKPVHHQHQPSVGFSLVSNATAAASRALGASPVNFCSLTGANCTD